jgi:hypothetical protein
VPDVTAFGHDPCRAVYEALEAAGCSPKGPPFKATARCPAHDDRDPSLTVGIGVDGRALVHCHAGCPVEAILEALRLAWPDLFPPGHHRARRRRLREARRADFNGGARTVANVLAALETLDADWFISLRCDCPHCGSPAAILQASPHGVSYSCPGDAEAEALGFTACTLEQFKQALAGRLDPGGTA